VSGALSKERLRRLTDRMRAYVDNGDIIGAQTLIYRHGAEAHHDIIGWQDDEANTPLARDTIFRIASMTKPITSVAALMLFEEGKFGLTDPIERWFPELANRVVLRDPLGPLDDAEPARRPITILDLFTHRSGLASSLADIAGPIAGALRGLTDGLGLRTRLGVDAWLSKLGELPLVYQPGARMNYGFSTDILGFLVARVSGMPFPDFLESRVFSPLGMTDTAFWVPPEKLGRLSLNYGSDWTTGARVLDDHPRDSRWATPPSVPSGAGGLVSTADDYLKFARLLLNDGEYDGARLLSRKTVELMTTDFLTPEQRTHPFFGFNMWEGQGFGLGVSVVDNPAGMKTLCSVGQYGWGGAFGTYWFNDPEEEMVCILMIQRMFATASTSIARDFTTLVYQAIDD
jgi:CubicO group peptidase (beta-lactamase class C family)